MQSCQQERSDIPAWPLDGHEAYAIELLGVIREDRRLTRRERECVADL